MTESKYMIGKSAKLVGKIYNYSSTRSNGMRLIQSASIIILLCLSVFSFSSRAQDVNFDDLLNELSFTDETSSASAESVETGDSGSVESASSDEGMNVDDIGMTDTSTEPSVDMGTDAVVDQSGEMENVDEAGLFNKDDTDAPAPDVTEDISGTETSTEFEEEPKVVTVTEKPTAVSKADAKLMAMQEEVRRQEREIKGQKSFESGMAAMNERKYDEAVKLLEDAALNIPLRPANDAVHAQISASLGEAYAEVARDQIDKDLTYARRCIDLSLKNAPDNRRAQSLEKRISAREKRVAEEVARPKSVMEQKKYSDKYESIDQLLREGRDLFDAREYNDAELVFERVLQVDEYNVEAMRFLRKIEDNRYDIKTKEREATVSGMMAAVRDTWNPPIRTDIAMPPGLTGQTKVDSMTSQQKLQKKMEGIIIPSIEFRQANITDVVNFLVDASVAGDPDGVGVNIILKLSSGGSDAGAAPAPVPVDDGFGGFGDAFGDTSAFGQTAAPASSGTAGVPAITLNLRRINLLDAIKYITEVADLRYRLEDNVVIITPANVVSGRVVTRMYPVQPSILDVIVERVDTDDSSRSGDFIGMTPQANVKRSDVKDFFERAGVPFPVGTSITYNQSISQLIVANTAENLETFERILSRLNVIPNQVEIEARFVEVNQTDLEELGFQWFLTDNWEIAQNSGSGSPAGQEALIGVADPQGYTKGNRFFTSDLTTGALRPESTVTKNANQSPLGGIAKFATVLTNPEVALIINALSQKGNADLLSAPRVTTRSGVNAQIQVVQEIIYPTEFETEVVTIQSENALGNTSEERFVTVTPGTFETREVGVILNVTPTVGPDGYTIDLTLAPEVAELIDWIQYGSSIGEVTYNIPQPVFASRNVTTSIVVWDGQTVVMGGLIREDLIKYQDKIPFLGDIPLIGRLFRSEGEHSLKKNLLIFVTARLVGPDGRPLQRGENIPGAEQVATGEVAVP
jgi:general secretion pathway protein D